MCKSCGSTQRAFDLTHGEVLCRSCGLVLADKLFASVYDSVPCRDGGREKKILTFSSDINTIK
jgi:transcription initiation factor TFIIIB Brf1 subunit/transcription initiation factor TFIIB